MTNRTGFIEKRKHNRFKVKDGVFVEFQKHRFLNLGKPLIAKSAPIIDINSEGLAFQYVDRNMWTPNFNELSILNSKTAEVIKIGKVPFKTIYDFSLSRLATSIFKRRCGIKFGKLTSNQKKQLNRFIQIYAV